MSEARNILVRPVDIAAVFDQRRQGVLEIFQDEPESTSNPLASPLRRASTAAAAAATPRVQTTVSGRGSGGSGTLRRSGVTSGRRNALGSSTVTRGPMGRENTVGVEGLHANQAGVELESRTPQEKFLNLIDNVEKSLKRTPTSNKAERERKIRILMSLR